MEAEADEYAIALLKKNGISTLPLAELLERLDNGPDEDEESPGWPWGRRQFHAKPSDDDAAHGAPARGGGSAP
jgi:hypothetical protein